MTGRARHVAALVLTAQPEEAPPLLVALQADGILIHRGPIGFWAEADVEGRICLILEMLAARPVTGLAALPLNIGPASLAQHPTVQGAIDLFELILVAALARLAADIGRIGNNRQ